MADKPVLDTISGNRVYSADVLNAILDDLASGIESCLGRGGTSESPNSMSGTLDLNTNRIQNLGDPVNALDAVNLQTFEANFGDAALLESAAAVSAALAAAGYAADAQTAETNAETAQAAAETAQTDAETAQTAAEAAQAAAEAAAATFDATDYFQLTGSLTPYTASSWGDNSDGYTDEITVASVPVTLAIGDQITYQKYRWNVDANRDRGVWGYVIEPDTTSNQTWPISYTATYESGPSATVFTATQAGTHIIELRYKYGPDGGQTELPQSGGFWSLFQITRV